MTMEPKVKILVEGGRVIEVQSDVSLDVQIIDYDQQHAGEEWLEAFITTPQAVTFEANGIASLAPPKAQDRENCAAELTAYNQRYLLSPIFNGHNDIIWYRDNSGLRTNVKRTVIHHSPDGFEIGYSGSGPADLALNIAAVLFPLQNEEDKVPCHYGEVSRKAWAVHQELKFELLSACGGNKGIIGGGSINRWQTMAELKHRKVERKNN